MKTLGNISISSDSEVVSFRNKLYDITLLLTNDDIFASKVASSISTFCKEYLKVQEINIETSIDFNSAKIGVMSLKFGPDPLNFDSSLIAESLFNNFGEFSKTNNNSIITYYHFFSSEHINMAQEIYNVKSTGELINDVKAKNHELELSLFNLKKAKDLNARMESELEVGQSIQLSMLPNNTYTSDLIDIYAYLTPAREVGGDFYDFFFVDDEHIGIVVGDVSGKGVPAALMMAVCKTLLKSHANGVESTSFVMTQVNNEMASENNNYMFVTAFMAIINTFTGEMNYSNAGHNPTYIRRKNGSIEKLTDLHGPVLAAVEGLDYKESKTFLNEGDYVILYTDGIPEAHNDKKEMFTDIALENFLLNDDFTSSKSVVENIIEIVEDFENGAERFDDITVLCVNYIGNS